MKSPTPTPGKKFVICPAPGCQERRIHHERDEPRGPQYIEVPAEWIPGMNGPAAAWCSLTCQMMAGAASARDPQPVFWQEFLKRYEHLGAHFHGEGDPPDLLLEVKPAEDSQDWLWEYRPQGTEPTDRVKNGLCWEMMGQMPRNVL